MTSPPTSVEPGGVALAVERALVAGEPGGGLKRRTVLVLAWTIAAALGVVDYASGTEIDVSLIYVFPVACVTWRASRVAGGVLSLFCAVVDTTVDVHLGRYPAQLLMLGWNVGLQSGLLLIANEGVHRLRRSVLTGRSLIAGLNDAYGRLDDEVRHVAEIQSSLLPAAAPDVPGYRIAVHYAMCATAGGDYYDFLTAAGRRGVLVADVSGHGPSAAVIMAMARVIVHAESDEALEPEHLLETANRGLVSNSILGHFVTACYAVLDPATGTVDFALAGHPRPVLARARSADAVEIGTPDGPPLAVDSGARYRRQRFVLEPGDVMVLYTDGLTEARSPAEELFGEERVLACAATARPLGADAVVARLLEDMRSHLEGLPAQDDVTIVVVERLAGDASV